MKKVLSGISCLFCFLMLFAFSGCNYANGSSIPDPEPIYADGLFVSTRPGGAVKVYWNNPKSTDFAGVKIDINGTVIDLKSSEVPNNEYTVEGLDSNSEYNISIKAYDSKGNEFEPKESSKKTFKPSENYVELEFSEVENYLDSLSSNTEENPHKIYVKDLKQENIGHADTEGTFGNMIKKNRGYQNPNTKYFDLKIDFADDVNDTNWLFFDCSNIVSAEVSDNNTITNASGMFNNCYNMKQVKLTGFKSVENASAMFCYCEELTEIDTSPFSNVINACSMFESCKLLKSIDTSVFTNVTNANNMFDSCESLTEIDTTPLKSLIEAAVIFSGCTNLKHVDTSVFKNITNGEYMFNGCKSLTEIDTSFFSKIENSDHMFSECKGLTQIDVSPFKSVTDVSMMLSVCSNLQTVYYSSETDLVYLGRGNTSAPSSAVWTLKSN